LRSCDFDEEAQDKARKRTDFGAGEIMILFVKLTQLWHFNTFKS